MKLNFKNEIQKKNYLLKKMAKKYSEPCKSCNKRSVYNTVCRCGHHVCVKHRFPENHNCDFDYKKEGKELLRIQLPIVVADKLPNF